MPALGGGGRGHHTGLHEAFPRHHLCKKGVREWGSVFVDSEVAGTRADEPAKLKEGDLNRPRYFHRKRFLENNFVCCCRYFLLAVKDEFGVKCQQMVF